MAQKKNKTTTSKRSKVNDLPMKSAKAARVKGGQYNSAETLASSVIKKRDDTSGSIISKI